MIRAPLLAVALATMAPDSVTIHPLFTVDATMPCFDMDTLHYALATQDKVPAGAGIASPDLGPQGFELWVGDDGEFVVVAVGGDFACVAADGHDWRWF